MKEFVQSSSEKGRARTVLTKEEVIEIFKFKMKTPASRSKTFSSAMVGKLFGVSPKTIRDIWVGRTWYHATQHLDPARQDSLIRFCRQPGRPKGSKDARPRKCTRRRTANSQPFQDNFGSSIAMFIPSSYAEHKILSGIQSDFQSESLSAMDTNIKGPPSDINRLCDTLEEAAFLPRTLPEFIDPFHDDWPHW